MHEKTNVRNSLIESISDFKKEEVKRIKTSRTKDYSSQHFKKMEKKLLQNNTTSFRKKYNEMEKKQMMLRCMPPVISESAELEKFGHRQDIQGTRNSHIPKSQSPNCKPTGKSHSRNKQRIGNKQFRDLNHLKSLTLSEEFIKRDRSAKNGQPFQPIQKYLSSSFPNQRGQ